MKPKIGIFGDSFCDLNPAERTDLAKGIGPWPTMLGELLNKPVEVYGYSGSSVWSAFKNFKNLYTQFDTVVFCYSDPDRWATVSTHYGISNIYDERQLSCYTDPEILKIGKILLEARPYLYDEDFNTYCYQKMFDDVNSMCSRKGIKIVNILAFEENIPGKLRIDISKATGSVLTDLNGISIYEERPPKLVDIGIKEPDPRFCHMNPHNNRVLANIIFDELSKFSANHIRLTSSSAFSYDAKHLLYLLE